MKIPVSTSVITNTKQIVSENPEDKVYHNGAFLRNKKENNELV